ncbi:MAG: 2-amino-4-hydroxy-6-hydroxymethyldihydropteridine diphosphokinase [Lamprobacter sp.]|uniref:2-amino-4-hydroxy-6- hydroxymethyldihydropteridine diphosphokinase n=1 Tax=Lamprobacter sp. TaxID=3100796 RepID=UPI002B25F173|nr:2-amino-4-hydroxy-6-hydroxymethyldihydropteridine diphosphokinase [Lamprobacter sp.]MEA3638402.1 2-amino-4-hydroxy-6-hydroxymethyldihydropteridine diphosphokinase [Lamprobacter sp.]
MIARWTALDDRRTSRRCWLSLGSNLARETSIRGGVQGLRQAFGALILSAVYETEAEGFDGQPFLNLVAGIDSPLALGEIQVLLRRIEAEHGRKRGGERFAPRTLDLDLLTYGDRTGVIDGYLIPRDEILRYAFVLGPLAEVAPDERHPTDGRRYAELWHQLQARLRDQHLDPPQAASAPVAVPIMAPIVAPPGDSVGEAVTDCWPLRRFDLDLDAS